MSQASVAPGPQQPPRLSRVGVAACILLVPGVMMTPVWFNGGLGAGEDDVLYYYPSRLFFHDSIAAGEWPAIQPLNGLGRPFLADPQSAFWYPPTWLFAALPPTPAYPASLWLHYCLAMWGVYRWVRSHGGGRAASLFGGLAFAFSGFMLAHRAHFAMQNAAAWTPWVLWRLERFVAGGGGARLAGAGAARLAGAGGARLAGAAGAAAMQCFAGHVQIAAMTALGGLVLVLFMRGPSHRRAVGRWLGAWLCAGALFAVQWLPTAAYVGECTRVRNNYWDFTQNSWHPAAAVGLAMPMLMGQRVPNWFDVNWWGPSHQVEQFAYAGLLPLLLAALALRAGGWTRPGRRGLIALAAFALLLALGKYGPVCPLLYALPGSSLFRVPARAMVLFNLAVAVLAALSLDDLMARHSPERVRLRWHAQRWARRPVLPVVVGAGAIIAAVALTAAVVDTPGRAAALRSINPLRPAIWAPILIGVASLVALRSLARGWARFGPLWPIVAVTALDLGLIGWSIDVPPEMPGAAALLNPPGRDEWARHIDDGRRLWVIADTAGVYTSPVAKGAANTNVLLGVPSLTDYGPLQPIRYFETFRFAPWGSPEDAEGLLRRTDLLRACDVGWILLASREFDPPSDCELVAMTSRDLRLYRLAGPRGPAWIEGARGRVEFERLSNHEFRTRATLDREGAAAAPADAKLVLSSLSLPGWSARRSDGTEAPIEIAHGVLMAAPLLPGRAPDRADADIEITWTYRTPRLRTGAAISACAAVAMAALVAVGSSRRTTRK